MIIPYNRYIAVGEHLRLDKSLSAFNDFDKILQKFAQIIGTISLENGFISNKNQTNSQNQNKMNIRDLITAGRLEKALEVLNTIFDKKDKDLNSLAVMLAARFNRLKREESLMTSEELRVEKARITQAALNLCDDYEKYYGKLPEIGQKEAEAPAKNLGKIYRRDIFISYSHAQEDKPHFEEVKKQLESLKYLGIEAHVWEDTQIRPGDNWEKEIEKALIKTRVAVLLVSPNFLASKFINEKEMVKFMELVESEQGKVIPVLLRNVPFQLHPFLKKYQFLNAGKPMNDISQSEKDALYVKMIETIAELYKADSLTAP
jgi:hypothetical protein